MKTDYPWDRSINLNIDPVAPVDLDLHIRIPGWAQGKLLPGSLYHYVEGETVPQNEVIMKVNGRRITKIQVEKGYAVIHRKWEKGDRVEMDLPMQVRLLAGNRRVEDTHGKAVIMRGPIVYCVEETDNKRYFDDANDVYLLPTGFKTQYTNDLLDGVVSIHGTASVPAKREKMDITAVPYYSWCNREQGHMKVWLPLQMK